VTEINDRKALKT